MTNRIDELFTELFALVRESKEKKQGHKDKRILITSALPYVNNVPHLGNLVGSVLSADVFARFCRQRGRQVLFVCGTDEYGTATETKARQNGISCQSQCNEYYSIHTQVYQWFNIQFDCFGRTATPQQTTIAQDIFRNVEKGGNIEVRELTQPWCTSCARFLADRYVEGVCPHCGASQARGDQCDACGKVYDVCDLKSPHCVTCMEDSKTSGGIIEWKSSKHLYLSLQKLQPRLESWFKQASRSSGLWSNNAIQVTQSWLKRGLEPRCITRDLKWGTPVPKEGFQDKVFYVWFDAPIGYISITANHTRDWQQWWKNPENVQLYQFMGKDNIPFHTVLFPATLLATQDEKWTLPYALCTTEYLTYEGGKFSKSRGLGVFGDNVQRAHIPADVWRYYLMAIRPETADANFSWPDFAARTNADLVGNVGNFIHRTLCLIRTHCSYKIPADLKDTHISFRNLVCEKIRLFIDQMEKVHLRDALSTILAISRSGNQFLQEEKPWQFEYNRKSVLAVLARVVYWLSVLLWPFVPTLSKRILTQLGLPGFHKEAALSHWSAVEFSDVFRAHRQMGFVEPLVQSITPSEVASLQKRFSGSSREEKLKLAVEVEKMEEELLVHWNRNWQHKTWEEKEQEFKWSTFDRSISDSPMPLRSHEECLAFGREQIRLLMRVINKIETMDDVHNFKDKVIQMYNMDYLSSFRSRTVSQNTVHVCDSN